MERIFKLNTGKIFKYDDEKLLFYSLDKNNQWVLDPGVMSVYYDAGSDYVELKEISGVEKVNENNSNSDETEDESNLEDNYVNSFEEVIRQKDEDLTSENYVKFTK